MTLEEVCSLIEHLEMIFDIVKIVDASVTKEFYLKENKLVEQPYHCYAVWRKVERCENCISARVLTDKGKLTKFEFINNDAYFVIAQYIEVDQHPYVLEIVSKIKDDVIFSAYEQNRFVSTITSYNDKMYRDSLTNAYNRYYYKDYLSYSHIINAIAIFDIDDFKKINDQYGHKIGDIILQEAINTIQLHMRSNDYIIRYGGDEFLLLFSNITRKAFQDRLEEIRKCIYELIVDEHPEIHISISIGGIFGTNSPDAITQADQLLYIAKANKNNVRIEDFNHE